MTLSIRLRLLVLTAIGLLAALAASGWVLHGLFAQHVQQQFERTLLQHLDQLTARLEFDPQGQPRPASLTLSDPRWVKPYSGLYWQIDSLTTNNGSRQTVLRSRSLWDSTLALASDPLTGSQWHVHPATGPQDQPLLVVERTLTSADSPGVQWRLAVAGDTTENIAATKRYTQVLGWSLAVLLAMLLLAAWAQVVVGLRPLSSLSSGLRRLQEGRDQRLTGAFPAEVQPLVDGFNDVLDQNQALLDRARTHAGNLAHALKTPLAVIGQIAHQPQTHPQAWKTVEEQLQSAQRHIDWHLRRARMAASPGWPGQQTDLRDTVWGLARVMNKIHAQRAVRLDLDTPSTPAWFAGEPQDLQEMLGNLLDNAFQWAHSRVQLTLATQDPDHYTLSIADDGPGVDLGRLGDITQRGTRLDESTPGSGLGLAIVSDLLQLYGGRLDLEGHGALGGLQVTLTLPKPRAHAAP